ncbi:MAG: glycosyltransferase family 4 protein [Candidatus Korarchaeota archaeon]|nr:glycosyltransferase family 4 protein [Candidatus Korarchaeota archaeon]NIU83088.1 glycosyltransferase [Candidatus Thorarchaeota archaeon]NIW12632.1 glycosyltransferase [Candidatus Thorarchaeota archaeon]NIW50843.1 glycosyltransferase [Candidatus Korarchaeota archaeon]
MNILILHWKDIKNPNAGGGTRYAHHIAQRLSKEHKVMLLSYRFSGSSRKTKVNENYTILRLGNKVTYHLKTPLYALKHRTSFDLILDSVILAPKLPLVSRFCQARKVALVHQFFNDLLREEFSPLIGRIIGFLEKLWPCVYQDFSFITVSESIQEKLSKRGISTVKVIHPGVPLANYEYHPARTSDSPLLIYIGRLKKYKGLQYAINAMEKVIQTFPAAKLLIAGRGDYDEALKEHIKEANVSEHVELLGYVSEAKKAEMLERAHLFLFPSVAEGWGISAIEAQACGIPVVGTDTDGLCDSVRDGETGRLVPFGKPDKLAEAIIELLSHPEKRKELAANAHQYAQRFSWERTLEQMENELLEG